MNLPHTLPRHKLSLKAYHQMAQAGILDEDSRVELIQGELIDMAPIGSRHAWMLSTLNKALVDVVANSAIVYPQNPIALPRILNRNRTSLCCGPRSRVTLTHYRAQRTFFC